MSAMKFSDLYSRVLQRYDNPGSTETTEAKQCVNDGYLRFLGDHDWAFMAQTASLSLDEGEDGVVALPAGFEAPMNDPVIVDDHRRGRLERRSIEWINEKIETSSQETGLPAYYAIRPGTYAAATGQAWEMVVWPWPDVDYDATMQYRPAATVLSGNDDYPMGGEAHSLTILQAALMMWEQRKGRVDGAERKLYLEQYLPASIARDRQMRSGVLGETPIVQPVGPLPHSVTYGGVL